MARQLLRLGALWRLPRNRRQRLRDRVPDLNILPPQYRGIELHPYQRRLAILGVLLLLFGLGQIAIQGEDLSQGLDKFVDRVRGREDPAVLRETQLIATVAALRDQVNEKKQRIPAVEAQQRNWAEIIDFLTRAAPRGVSITSIIQSRNDKDELDVSGIALQPDKVTEFRTRLIQSPLLSAVNIRTLQKRTEGIEFLFTVKL